MTLSGEKARIRLGATPSILKLIGTDLLIEANALIPDVGLEVVEELSFILTEGLARGELDYVLAYEVEETPGIRRIALLEEELLYVCRAGPEEAESTIAFRKVVAGDLALVSNRDIIWRLMQDTASRLSLDVNITYLVQSNEAIKALVLHGIAQSIIPYGIVADEIKSGQIRAQRIVQPSVRRTLYLAYSIHHGTSDQLPFLRFIDRMVERLLIEVGPYAESIGRLVETEGA